MYKRIAAAAVTALLVPLSHAEPIATDHGTISTPAGFVLYVFDQDEPGKSNCNGDCATAWPPFAVEPGARETQDFTAVERADGTRQWAYKGKALYTFAGDTKAGTSLGDGRGGVWHVARIGAVKSAAAPRPAPSYDSPYY